VPIICTFAIERSITNCSGVHMEAGQDLWFVRVR
jgi:hypothetical protein